ncbi:DUF4190 domain-containing protein [Nonomuraea sp. NBC_01738]|uniref:DUF4190 domain-containing protein n=1 Tax=Nonomuraea sp. NBC_01738 TaxID=2976003 RepID=UPI002E11D3D6|nr:DUF4190 domain-containing protein [Nonomuraea sp. NBC_01738]
MDHDGQYPAPTPYPVYVRMPASGMATASLVLALVGLFGGWCLFGLPCVLAVIFGHVAMKETREGQRTGRGQAVAGLLIGYITVIPMILATLALLTDLLRA